MNSSHNLSRNIHSDADLAQMILHVAQAVQADAILCITETGALVRYLHDSSSQLRIIAATPNNETFDTLTQHGKMVLQIDPNVAHGPITLDE